MPPATPTRRALLISSPRNGYIATGPALVRMREFLTGQGFVISDDACIDGDQATRAAIVTGFDTLIKSTEPGDIVVIYYAGHGGLFPDRVGANIEPYPVLEPMDIADSDAGHFNGLLGGELRLFLRALAQLCDNVTAIFDCCHAAGLVSSDDARDRKSIAEVAARAGERIARRRAEASRNSRRSERDPGATGVVRLVASSASERAYAYHGRSMLLFTDILLKVLEEHGLAEGLTWDQVIREVRARVQEIRPEQRPGVEGARHRRPFSVDSAPTPADYFHVQHAGPRIRLAAGEVVGIRHGETFELLPYAGTSPLGHARATDIKPFHAFLELPRDHDPLPTVMFARRLRDEPTRLAARLVTSNDPVDIAAASQLLANDHLRPPLVGDVPRGQVALLDELDPDGTAAPPQRVAQLALTNPDLTDDLTRAVRRLERWADLAAQLMHTGLGPLAGCYTLTWGRLVGDELEPLRAGDFLHPGELLGVRVHNPGRASTLHLQLYRVGADRYIDPWRDVDGGLAILTGHTPLISRTIEPTPGLPGPHREWLVVAIGDGAFDLTALPTAIHARPREPLTRSDQRHPGEASRVEIFGVSYMLAGS